jgi:pimeloyl-ACP methyl ester carboxylesterase
LESIPGNGAIQYFTTDDGVRLAYRELGEGRPLILIHGYFSTASVNWVRYGHAAKLAGRGYRVIMPDLRGHGDSDRPHDADRYPKDVLARDGIALVAHLGLTDYDLGGYSLGARTTIRMLVNGATPGRAIIAGMGLQGLLDTGARAGFFRRVLTNPGSFERSTPEWMAEAFLKTVKGDPIALLRVLDTFADTSRADLERIAVRSLIVAGIEDHDNGSAQERAGTLQNARFAAVPGNHMTAVIAPELGNAFAAFLGNPDRPLPDEHPA